MVGNENEIRPVSRRVLRGFDPSRLTEARERRNWSRADLARVAGLGVATVHQWERGQRRPQVDTLRRVAEVLGVTIDDLVLVPELDRHPGDWRVSRGLTQPELGRLADVSTTSVGAIERGEIPLAADVAARLAAVLRIGAAEYFDSYERVRTRPPGEPA